MQIPSPFGQKLVHPASGEVWERSLEVASMLLPSLNISILKASMLAGSSMIMLPPLSPHLPITSTSKTGPLSFEVFMVSKHEVWRVSRSGCQQMRLEAYYERISSDEYAHTMTNPKSATRHARGRLDMVSGGV